MIKAVFMDLDGTLLDCANGRCGISDYSREVFGRLKSQGILLFVASGRSVSFIPPTVRDVGFDGYVLVNGADVQVGEQVLSVHTLDPQLTYQVTRLLEEEKIEYALQIPGGTWMSKERSHILPYFRQYMFDETFLIERPLQECLGQVMKLELYVFPEQYEYCKKILGPLDYMYTPELNALEAYSKTVSKGSGAEEIFQYLGLDRSEGMCFGDAQNDLELFQTAGWAVAVGNAHGLVVERADDVCRCVWEDGVAEYLDQWFLQNKYIDKQIKV